MSDLSSLAADQLAEKVREFLPGPDAIRFPPDEQEAHAALAELQTLANHGTCGGVNCGDCRDCPKVNLYFCMDSNKYLKTRAEAAEARLAETLEALHQIGPCPSCGDDSADIIARAALTTHPAGDYRKARGAVPPSDGEPPEETVRRMRDTTHSEEKP